MRTFQLATVAALVAAASPALAEDAAGTYEVKYEEVADNCTTGLSMARGELNIRNEGKNLVVDIARVPKMYGKPNKTGVVRATSTKGRTSIEGLDGKFSVAGRADGNVLELVLVAEYYVKDSALCTQSWNVSGNKKSEAKAQAAAPQLSMPLLAPAR